MMAADPTVMEVAPAVPADVSLSDGSSTAVNHGDTPEQELAKIRQLAQQDHEGAATRRLQAFHRAHPQWSIPADLHGLLDKP